jgi:hypothetical protein
MQAADAPSPTKALQGLSYLAHNNTLQGAPGFAFAHPGLLFELSWIRACDLDVLQRV